MSTSYCGYEFNMDRLEFSRTQSHVNMAKRFRDDYIKKGFVYDFDDDSMSIDQYYDYINGLLRGTFLLCDSGNRIAYWIDKIQPMLNEIGYYNCSFEDVTYKDWDIGDEFTEDDFLRLLNRITTLRNAFFTYPTTPNTPKVSFYYEDINSIEKILYDLNEMVQDVKDNYRECGNYVCGEG